MTDLQRYAIVSPSQLRRLSDGALVPTGLVTPPPPPPAGGVLKLGIYTSYQSSQASVQAAEAWLGKQYHYVLEFMGVESTFAMQFENYFQDAFRWLGPRRLLLGATLTNLAPNGNWNRQWSWQQMADGIADTTWTNLRNNLIAYGQADCTLRGPHEFTNDKWSHRIYQSDLPAAINAWRRWHGIMMGRPESAFQFNWNPETGDYAKTGVDIFSAFPGKQYVTRIDFDLYFRWHNRGTRPGSSSPPGTGDGPRSVTEQNDKFDEYLQRDEPSYRGLNALRRFAVAQGLPLGASEWGLGAYFNEADGNHGSGDDDIGVHRFADFVFDRRYPIGTPGAVDEACFWEDGATGVRPLSPTNPDLGRAIPTPRARAAYRERFGA